MEATIRSNSLVILAKSHNPTLISDTFLLESQIINDIREVNPKNKLITPAITQLQLLSGTAINLDFEKLIVSGSSETEPFKIGNSYCEALPFIKASAVGINFDCLISGKGIKEWFKKFDIDDIITNQVVYHKYYEEHQCNITVTKDTDTEAGILFNFHYSFKDRILKELKIDFEDRARIHKMELEEIIKMLFNK